MPITTPTPSLASWPAEDLEACPACPACGARTGSPWFADLPDRLYGSAPGLWSFQRCARCRAAYLDPRPTPETIGRAYTGYYTHTPSISADAQAAGSWRRALRHGYLNRRFGLSLPDGSPLGPLLIPLVPGLAGRQRRWARLPRPHDGASLLDVGTGSGGAVDHFRALGWEAIGIDIDRAAVAAARASELPVTEGEITAVLGSDRFDAITMSHSIEHLHDPAGALRAVHRLLKPAGVLQLTTPNAGSLGRRMYARDWLGLDPPRHLVVFTPRALTLALREAGLAAVRFERSSRPAAWYFEASEALRQGVPWTEPVRPRPLARLVLRLSRLSTGALPRLAEELVVTAVKPPAPPS